MDSNFTDLEQVYHLLLPINSWLLRNLAQEAAIVAELNFEWRYLTIVVFLQTGLGIGEFFKAYGKTVVIRKGQLKWTRPTLVSQVIIYGKNLDEIQIMLSNMSTNEVKLTGRFIIVCTDTFCDETRLMEICWKYKMINVVLIKQSDVFGEFTTVSYYPFATEKCEDTTPVTINRTDCNDTCIKQFFPEKLKNLHRCQMIVSVFEQAPLMYIQSDNRSEVTRISGGDAELVLILAELMNASLKIVTPQDGGGWGHQDGDKWTGSLGDIQIERANFSLTSAAITYARYRDFQMSIPYKDLVLVWVTCPANLRPGWEKIIYPYKTEVRILIIATFIMVVCINYFTKTKIWTNIRKQLNIAPTRINLLFKSWEIFMAMPINFNPTSFSIVILFLFWSFYSFWIRVGYQTVLISTLEVYRYEEGFNTFEEATIDDKNPFGGVMSLKQYYVDDKWIYNGWTGLSASDMPRILEELAHCNSQFVMAIDSNAVYHFLRTGNGRYKIQILPQPIVNSPVVIFFKKFSPLAEPINILLSRLLETGLIQCLNQNYDPRGNIHRAAWMKSQNEDKAIPLKYSHFIGCWVLIVAGWLVSTICFLVEFKYYKQ